MILLYIFIVLLNLHRASQYYSLLSRTQYNTTPYYYHINNINKQHTILHYTTQHNIIPYHTTPYHLLTSPLSFPFHHITYQLHILQQRPQKNPPKIRQPANRPPANQLPLPLPLHLQLHFFYDFTDVI